MDEIDRMKLMLTGSHLCQDTMYAPYKLKEHKATVDFQNIFVSILVFNVFLKNRGSNPAYD